MSNETKARERRKQAAINALRELARRIECGELKVLSQGLWPGATSNVWNFHLEVVDQDVIQTLSQD